MGDFEVESIKVPRNLGMAFDNVEANEPKEEINSEIGQKYVVNVGTGKTVTTAIKDDYIRKCRLNHGKARICDIVERLTK